MPRDRAEFGKNYAKFVNIADTQRYFPPLVFGVLAYLRRNASIDAAAQELGKAGLAARVMIDMSHANSSKDYARQMLVADDIAKQIAGGDDRIFGVMVESHLNAGRQDLVPGKALVYGQSITDACIGWDDSVALLQKLAAAVRARRLAVESKIA